jgi:hypothetical protein
MVNELITLLDGGMGTELRARGVEVPDHTTSIWSAKALLADPQAIVAVHRDYIEAGAVRNHGEWPRSARGRYGGDGDGWRDLAQLDDAGPRTGSLAKRRGVA